MCSKHESLDIRYNSPVSYSPRGDSGEQAYQVAQRNSIQAERMIQSYISSLKGSYSNSGSNVYDTPYSS